MEDGAKYNATISTILGKVIGDNILKIPESERVKFLHWILQEQYKDTNERLAVIQKFLDKHTGIDLEPKKAPFPAERVQQLGTSLTDHTVPDETIQRRARAGSANIAASFHDDYVKENAKCRSNAGMKCYLERKVSGKCCPWCRALAGRYVYGSEPSDLFRRHDNCTCQVTYESGRTRQNVWTKKTWEERPAIPETPKPTVFSHEQAKQTEAEALLKLGLTKTADGGIIKAPLRLNMQFFGSPNFHRQTTAEIKKSIRSLEARIAEHERKIAEPLSLYPEWESLSDKAKEGTIKHWEKEISNFRKQIEAAHNELKRRSEE